MAGLDPAGPPWISSPEQLGPMALDKNKIIAEATKLLQKGAFDKAIKQYERILQEDAKDVRVLLKVGELYQKKGDDRMAADAFKRVAETYADQGFFLKSVAVYKQVVKLDGDDVRVNERLSGLYQQLGLLSEAMAQLQVIASAHEKAGDGTRLLETLKRMVELDPENIGSVVRLGKLYQGANQPGPALEHYRRAAAYLKTHNRADDYLKVAERIVELAPADLALARELANIYMAKGDTKRALAKLQVCFKADGRDVETLALLAQAFRDLGQTSKTVQVFKTLADVHERAGRRGDAISAWRKVAELAPADPDAVRVLGEGRPGPSAPPPMPAAVARPAPPTPGTSTSTPIARVAVSPPLQAYSAPRPSPPPPPPPPLTAAPPRPAAAPGAAGAEGIGKLLTETEVYLKYGLADKALSHLRAVLAIDPQAPVALEKLRDLHQAAGRRAEALDAAERAVRSALAKGELDRAKESLTRLRAIDPRHATLAELTAATGSTEEIELSAGEVEEQLEAGELPATPEELALGDEPPRPIDDDALAELSAEAAGDEVVEDEPVLRVAPPTPAPEAVRAAAPWPSRAPLVPPPPAPPAPRSSRAKVELERSDELLLALAQASLDTEEVVGEEALQPPPPEPDGPLAEELDELPAEPEQRPFIVAAPEPPPDLPPREEQAPRHADLVDLADEFEEAEFFAQQGLLSEARESLLHLLEAHPGHPALETRLADVDRRLAAKVAPLVARAPAAPQADPRAVRQSPSLVDPAASAGGSFDIGAELAEELDRVPDLGLDDEFQYSVEDVFNQFKRGVAETVTAEDSDTHYDLGIAYKEMGLVDDAVNEFETALRGNNRKREVESLSMIALCRMSQGRPRDALDPLRRALRSDYLNKENAKAIHFELGLAHQELGEREEALWCFQKVTRLEATYRGVAARIAGLGGGPGRPPPGMAAAAPHPVAGLPRPGSVPVAGAAAPRPSTAARPAAAQASQPAPGPRGPKKNIGFL